MAAPPVCVGGASSIHGVVWTQRGLLQVVVAWGTEQVGYGGEVAILAKAHTDVDIQAFVVSGHDETR